MKICGLDEVGRGAFAGPIVGCGVIFGEETKSFKNLLADSKKLSGERRRYIFELIKQTDTKYEIEIISTIVINERGIGWANKELFRKIISKTLADEYIIDGNLKMDHEDKSKIIKSVIKADGLYPEVMAASIIAKVIRDLLMVNLAEQYINYGWKENVGYGTSKHIQGIKTYGICDEHRKLFVRKVLAG